MVIERRTTPLLREQLAEAPVVWIRGARQVGKSTLAQRVDPGRRYITFDDDAARAAVEADPQGFALSLTAPVTLDEVQRVPRSPRGGLRRQ